MICEKLKIDVPYEKYNCKKEKKETTLNTYILNDYPYNHVERIRPAVIICPGGGYSHVSEREAEPIAIQFNAMGYHAFVLDYSIAPSCYPAPQLELAKAILTVRAHAEEWHVDSDKIVLCGFSAGGHLAAYLGICWDEEFLSKDLGAKPEDIKPNALILCYPVITSGEYAHKGSFECLLGERYDELNSQMSLEKRVSSTMPKTFLWTTMTDGTVPVENSIFLLEQCRKNNVPIEAHFFPEGHHGMSLCNEETSTKPDKSDMNEACQIWTKLAAQWMKGL